MVLLLLANYKVSVKIIRKEVNAKVTFINELFDAEYFLNAFFNVDLLLITLCYLTCERPRSYVGN